MPDGTDLHAWTREKLLHTPVGTVVHLERLNVNLDPKVCFLIMRGPAGLCAYLTVGRDHPLQREDWPEGESLCHGGITLDAPADWDEGLWAWGWDYSQAFDQMLFVPEVEAVLEKSSNGKFRRVFGDLRLWLPLDVWADSQPAILAFKQAVQDAAARATDGRIQPGTRRKGASELARERLSAFLESWTGDDEKAMQ